MENDTQTVSGQDGHKFGYGDYLSANDYAPDDLIKVHVRAFLGRQDYEDKNKRVKRAGMYRVVEELVDVPQEFRLGIKNEKIAAKKFGIKDYAELVDRTLTLKVKKFNVGNGFVLVDISGTQRVDKPRKAAGVVQAPAPQ